ncbi:MAG: glycoside hydrolase family 30 beta sandwich domain-containing protein [Terracidiphilus sp.]|nr:glycoside hydrolase family 30 beta sandwich domain-containing protein [Terracidiphilus sp.]
MDRSIVLAALLAFAAVGSAQTAAVYTTTPDLKQGLAPGAKLHFTSKTADVAAPVITVDPSQRFQEIDGFGASLTDSAAWLFAKKLPAAQTDAAFAQLFSRKKGIGINILRQPVGSSDLAVTFYSFDDLCAQQKTACTTPPGVTDPELKHFSLAHDEEYILPMLRKALKVNPGIHVMLTPWSPPGWMKTSGTMLGSNDATKEMSHLRKDAYGPFAQYLAKTVEGYQKAGVPVWALSVENEPLFGPPTYSGMVMEAADQAAFFGEALAPALEAARLHPLVMAYDHNWDRPDYPETVLKDAKAGALAAGTAWHHYEGKPEVMTKNHEEFPQKGQWVTESSGGTWQTGNVLAEEAGELIAVTRNWAKAYVLWALATDEKHGPVVGGCDTCRGLVTLDLSNPEKPVVKPELDYYVLGHASKFLAPGAVRIASDEPKDAKVKDVAFRNPDGTIVLYTLNTGTADQQVRIAVGGKSAVGTIPAGGIATFVWK